MEDWLVFKGTGEPQDRLDKQLPPPPPWRQFTDEVRGKRGEKYQADRETIELVNAALYLRRPLLVTGQPGTGKSSLAYAVAHELKLGQVLLWPITTRSALQEGLYRYDAIGRLQDASLRQGRADLPKKDSESPQKIGQYITLGPLGTALLPQPRPRVLLIDELDKSDIDLPNDLLHTFEEGEFRIPELERLPRSAKQVKVSTYDGGLVSIERGHVRCDEFPFVVLTSNAEREFPPAFLRRCLRLEIPAPDENKLARIVTARLNLSEEELSKVSALIAEFIKARDEGNRDLSTDQLLNAVYFAMKDIDPLSRDKETLRDALWRSLTGSSGI